MPVDKILLSYFVEKANQILNFEDDIKYYTMRYGSYNLLSVTQFCDKEYKIDFGMIDCSIYPKKIRNPTLK